MVVSDGHLLGGRVGYAQPREGFRSGIEPVLLGAAIPARSGDRVLEGGTGAGATLLCLSARVPGVVAVGVERDPAMAELARRNASANDFPDVSIVTGDIEAIKSPAGLGGPFDHACANPPYHPESGSPSPINAREQAKRGSPSLLADWAMALGSCLRPRGTLTLILPAFSLPLALAALEAGGCRPEVILPLWPRTGRPCKLLLVRGIRDSGSPLRLLPGLVLHAAEGGYTRAAEAILRDGAELRMG